jgi:ribosomal protein S18 acetylase RimI-like enzyme
MSEFNIRPLDNVHDAQAMAHIRNEVRDFMTHDTSEIDPDRQLAWYFTEYLKAQSRNEMLGYLATIEEKPVGYGLITKRSNRYWVSGGLLPEAQGQGHGETLFGFMTDIITDGFVVPANLDVLRSNERAINLYRKLGYKAVGGDERLIVMEKVYEPQSAQLR